MAIQFKGGKGTMLSNGVRVDSTEAKRLLSDSADKLAASENALRAAGANASDILAVGRMYTDVIRILRKL